MDLWLVKRKLKEAKKLSTLRLSESIPKICLYRFVQIQERHNETQCELLPRSGKASKHLPAGLMCYRRRHPT